ncbi:YihY/virulence factor BrkB family protein [Luteibaculum oceani]|uniref:YihY/virulence factor BrkB family protein n=1 Tax=Luteibaculum oceani TaxID=1294296 RepID=A0A5C6VAH3_9FLAO|nr:YihY/virulence factor BrkB family protein [Luteibaculum oceani]TXC81521.1 YihY/virulence factor BrkB family protein [Luteibaculum oceani]
MIKERFFNSRYVLAIQNFAKQIKLPGFEGLSLFTVIAFLIKGLKEGRINTRAAAISFKVLLAIAPTFILLISLIPYIPIDNFQANLINTIESILPPSTYDMVDELLVDLIHRKHNTFVSVTFIIGLYYASNSINALLEGLSGAYHLTKKQNPIKQRLLSVGLIVLLPLFLGGALLLQASSSYVLDWLISKRFLSDGLETFIILFAKWFLVVMLINSAVSALYNVATPAKRKWRFFSPGSIFAALLMILASQGFAFYVNNFGQFNRLYGSLGTVVILLIWIQLIIFLLLLGFDLNTSLSRARRHMKNVDSIVK